MAIYSGENTKSYNHVAINIGFGEEAKQIHDQFLTADYHFNLPYSRQINTIEHFYNLAQTWRDQTRITPTVREMVSNPLYLEIIAMGKQILPAIFQELKKEPDHWFPALKAITGIDPVPKEHRGKVALMSEDWLIWGNDNGFI